MTQVRPSSVLVLASTAILSALLVLLAVMTPWTSGKDSAQWGDAGLVAVVAVVGGMVALAAGTAAAAAGDRRRLGSLGVVGAALTAYSACILTSGLLTPGAFLREPGAGRLAALFAVPAAALVALPIARGHTAAGQRLMRQWRNWSLLTILAVFAALAAGVAATAVMPEALPSPPTWLAALVGLAGAAALMPVAGRLARSCCGTAGNQGRVAAVAMVAVALSGFVPAVGDPLAPEAWGLRLVGLTGVLIVSFSLVRIAPLSPAGSEAFSTVFERWPLAADQLVASPLVRTYLDWIDQTGLASPPEIGRTVAMAVRLGERFGLADTELYELALATLLHDIGKIAVPIEVLAETGRLSPEARRVMNAHTVGGAAMLAADPLLASIAPIARSHHERFDGQGYPDGLAGSEIPLPARIIAVCDALDALSHDRPYRSALPLDLAFAVVREHAGSQWDPVVVERLLTIVPDEDLNLPRPAAGSAVPVIPDDIAELLVRVDAEI